LSSLETVALGAITFAFTSTFSMAANAEPSAESLVRKYDAVMSPGAFEGVFEMAAHRSDGTIRHYKFRVLKSGDDKVRSFFLEPAAAKGQEMLKVGDNMWIYMPNLKRALRIASRESFQGGDFNNGDILRVSYVTDYTARLVPSDDPTLWALELAGKTAETTYDRIKLWMRKETELPVKAEYYAASGKLLRSAAFDDVRNFHGLERPARIVMRNELAKSRFTELTLLDMKVGAEAPAQKFVLDDLGR
jgi:outer membrane lipoprotein-sorting protein